MVANGKNSNGKSANTKSYNGSDAKNSKVQIALLRCMALNFGESVSSIGEPRPYQINEIGQITGHEEKEILRALYILEGHKLVSPHPIGDFTSKSWQITGDGLQALQTLDEDLVARTL